MIIPVMALITYRTYFLIIIIFTFFQYQNRYYQYLVYFTTGTLNSHQSFKQVHRQLFLYFFNTYVFSIYVKAYTSVKVWLKYLVE